MKQILAAPLALLLCTAPLYAQEETERPSLMERGAQMFLEGLMKELTPAFDDLAELMGEAGPALESFVTEMGPKLRDLLEEVEDWSVYSAPEVLPNGDIIIRRKPDLPEEPETAPKESPQSPPAQIEL